MGKERYTICLGHRVWIVYNYKIYITQNIRKSFTYNYLNLCKTENRCDVVGASYSPKLHRLYEERA